MKGIAVILAAIFAVICGLPQSGQEIGMKQERIVGDLVTSALENISQQIREAGLDPWSFEKFAIAYELPVPVLFSGSAFVEDILFTGISDIVVNHINYGLFTSRLTFDISIPEIAISLGGAGFDVTALGSRFKGNIDGRLAIIEPRVSGVVQMNVGIISGIFVRDMNLDFDLEAVRYNGNVDLFGVKLTGFVTDFVTEKIPNAVRAHRFPTLTVEISGTQINTNPNEINELVEIIAWEVVNQIL